MKKRILLVNPHIEDFAAYDHFSKPLGLLRLAAYLKPGFDLHFIDAMNRSHPGLAGMKFRDNGTGHFYKTFIPKPAQLSDIPRRFKRYGLPDGLFRAALRDTPFRPDYIFITSAMTYWYTGVVYTIGLIREVFADTPIVLGGIYPSLMPEHAAMAVPVDYIVPHQRLARVLKHIGEMTGVELNSVEYRAPEYGLTGEFYYAPVYTSLGCVYACAYCASNILGGFEQFPPERVAEDILRLRKQYGVRHFAFYDDALFVNSGNHLDRILEILIRAGFDGKFYTPNGLHIRLLAARTARLMKESGFADIRLSLESSDPEFQQSQGAKATNREFENAIGILHTAGFGRKNIHVYTLVNIPGQDASGTGETMRYIFANGAVPRLAYYSPIPGTPDFRLAEKITPLGDPLFHNNSVYMYRSGFDYQTLLRLKELEIRYRRQAEAED
ncbi:MAG: radical SAM protein [Brevinematales bacterium]|nr:radical SAM protein [Brevinematales bacterium]